MTPANQLPVDLSQPQLPATLPGVEPVAPTGVQLEPLPGAGYVDPRLASAAPPAPAAAQLSPEDAAAIQAIAGVDPAKAKAMHDAAVARAPIPPRTELGGPQVLEPLPQDQGQPAAPQYHVERVPVGSSSTSGSSGVSKQSEARIRGAQEKVFGAVADEIEAQAPQRARDAAAAQQVASLADERARLSAQHAADAAKLRDQITKDNADARAKLDKDVADYQLAGDRIDPNRVWHRMDTGNKIAFALAAGLQGFASGLQGHSNNVVLEMLTAAQERDLRAQEIGLNAKARGVQMRESMYGRLVEAGHDREIALLAARDASNHTIADQIAASQAGALTAPAAELMDRTAKAQQTKMANDRLALEQAVARHTTSSSTTQTQAVLVDQNGLPVQKPTAADAAAATVDNLTSIPGVRVLNRGLAMHAESNRGLMKSAQDQLQGVQQIHVAAKAMTDASNKYGTSFGITAEGAQGEAEFNAAKKAFIAGVRNAFGEHATDQANQSLESLVDVSLSDWRQVRTRAKIKGLTNTATKEVNARYSALGLGFDENDWEGRQSGNGIVRQVQ